MRYRITKFREYTNYLYVDIDIIDNAGQVIGYNDFLMQISLTHTRYIGPVDEDNSPTEPTNPDNYETLNTDIRQVIIDNVEAYLNRHDNRYLTFDRRSAGRLATDTDTLGLRSKPGVSDLIDEIRQTS